ncbi:PspC domain-containing protein [Isoptericola chiayiensis]|uniref:PspC domain-containing protein n=1 Tax=Isoptericola chiayiensis TaxID=579446 RepID=A0ABP8YNZ6_9MICO|nr:PspC domain-containing protein [Isoptericola chiayiensis]NOW02388.1 phage shock protein PspC (stress-responsive transcriptional regulator) [Isoptericola chiayiensis]
MSNPQTAPRKLYRPSHGRMIGGVCAGVADYFGWSRGLVRLLTALSVIIPGPQFLAYIVFWILMPDERKALAG